MKKKNIAFILFGVAAMNIITLPIIPIAFAPLYARLSAPEFVMNMAFTISFITGLIAASILSIAGIIVYFKFRRE